MVITEVRIKLCEENNERLLAFCSVTFDNAFVVRDLKIIEGTKGVFVAKHEIDDWTMAGKMVRNMGTIFVNRQNRRDIPRAGDDIIEALSRGEGVIVFTSPGSGR